MPEGGPKTIIIITDLESLWYKYMTVIYLQFAKHFLRGNGTLSVENYTWVGNNRINLNPSARRGSGGVGAFVKNDFLTKYTFEADKSLEDILILKFTNRFDKSAFVLFIGYPPPDFSTRAVDRDAFFNDLSKKFMNINQKVRLSFAETSTPDLAQNQTILRELTSLNRGWLLIQQLIAIVTFY